VGNWLEEYERLKDEVEGLKKIYEDKARISDEAAEEARRNGLPLSPPLTSFPANPSPRQSISSSTSTASPRASFSHARTGSGSGSISTGGIKPLGLSSSATIPTIAIPPPPAPTPATPTPPSNESISQQSKVLPQSLPKINPSLTESVPKSAKEFAASMSSKAGGLARSLTQSITRSRSPGRGFPPKSQLSEVQEDGEKKDKGKGREVDPSTPGGVEKLVDDRLETGIRKPDLVEVGGIVKSPEEWSKVFKKAFDTIPKQE
jgi:hypothetical protein